MSGIIVVDTFSTGALLASTLHKLGYKVICVLSGDLKDLLKLISADVEVSFVDTIVFDTSIDKEVALENVLTKIKLVGLEPLAVIAGAETGVELADQISEALDLRTNGTKQSEARRNKFIMGETIRNHGIRAVKQLRATTWNEIDDWIGEDRNEKLVIKPNESAGSDSVTLCNNYDEVRVAFDKIMGKPNGLGVINEAVLAQEYLDGQEYVIDTVSKDGIHKVVAIWAYDKRPANGAGFVCFGQRLLTVTDDPNCRILIDYQLKVLTALGIKNGPTHGEVKWCRGEPVLIEVGARCHGAEGAWQSIANAVYGYDQVQCTIDVYLNNGKFEELPYEPIARKSYGRLLFLICYETGTLEKYNEEYVREIKEFTSFQYMEFFVKPNGKINKTIDCFTFGGLVKLVNSDLQQLVKDYNRIREMEQNGLFLVDITNNHNHNHDHVNEK